MRLTRTRATLAMAAMMLLGAATVRAASTPEETVKAYLKAMQGQKYEDAYKQISKAMAGGKDSEAWSKEQKYMMETAGAQCLLLAGFFEGQMRQRHNIRWYASLGAGFFSRAALQEASPHKAQLLSYLKLLDVPLGLLINFQEMKVADGVSRLILSGANL